MASVHDRASGTAGAVSRDQPSSVGDPQSPVMELLRAYEDVLGVAMELPSILMVPDGLRHRRDPRRLMSVVPAPRLLVTHFVVRHVHRALDPLRRRLLAAAALGTGTPTNETDRTAVDRYLESLPPRHRLIRLAALLAATLLVTQLLLVNLQQLAPAFGGPGVAGQGKRFEQVLQAVGGLSGNVLSLIALLRTSTDASLQVLLFLATTITTVLYVELRPLVPSFRLKRAMFCAWPDARRSLKVAPWSTGQRSTGLYVRERAALAAHGAPAPSEQPFDLIVSSLVLPAVLYLGGLTIASGYTFPVQGDPGLSLAAGSAIIACAGARGAWLLRVRVRRRRDRGPYAPYAVRLAATGQRAVVRDPLVVLFRTGLAAVLAFTVARSNGQDVPGAAGAVTLFVFPLLVAPLWYRLNRDLQAVLRARGDDRSGRPWRSFLAMLVMTAGFPSVEWLFFPAAAVVAAEVGATTGRLRRAVSLAGAPQRLLPTPLLVTGFVVFPAVLAHLQHVLNGTLHHAGEVADPLAG